MNQLVTQAPVLSCPNESAGDIISTNFWHQWQEYRGYLYRCCVRWTGNPNDAEDALSQAMMKAWEKVREGAGAINNFKSWLTKLTYNVCIDLHRQRNRSGSRVESLDAISAGYQEELVSQEKIPDLVA